MNAKSLGIFTPGTPEWHEARRGGLGGSEIAAVIGLSPWQSPFSLWHLKAGTLPPPPSDEQTFKQELGHVLEDAVAQLHLNRHPGRVLARSRALWRNSIRPWQLGEVDRLVVATPKGKRPSSALECKTADSGDAWQWGPDGGDQDDVPPYYATQAAWYLDLFGFSEVTLAVLIGAREYREYSIRHSTEDVQFLRDRAVTFLDSVARGEAPPIDGHDATYQAVRELHPSIDGTAVEVPLDVAHEFASARAGLAAAETAWNTARSTLADVMGTAASATFAGLTLARRQAKGTRTPYVVAARGLPPTIEQPEEGTAA